MRNYQYYENKVISDLKLSYKLKIEEANFSEGWIPRHIILDKTRNIHSYLIPFEITESGIKSSFFDDESFSVNLIELLKVQYSKLDRPLFFVFYDKDINLSVVEGNFLRTKLLDQIENNILNLFLDAKMAFADIANLIKGEL